MCLSCISSNCLTILDNCFSTSGLNIPSLIALLVSYIHCVNNLTLLRFCIFSSNKTTFLLSSYAFTYIGVAQLYTKVINRQYQLFIIKGTINSLMQLVVQTYKIDSRPSYFGQILDYKGRKLPRKWDKLI